MRKITVIFCFCKLSSLILVANALTYDRCELISELFEKYHLPLQDSIGMTCVANSVSELRTTHAQTDTLTNRRVFGMFGISEGTACKFGAPGFCKVTCDKFLDNDISDDLECLQKILESTSKRPKVFKDCESYDWKNFMQDCQNEIKKVDKREANKSKFFKLRDFEVLSESVQQTTIMRPGPPANILPRNDDYDEEFDEDLFKKSNKEPEYVTDEPPRPFSRPKSIKQGAKQRNGNRKNNKRIKKPKQQSKTRLNLNPMSSVIKTPILPMEFHVIPGPSVSVPISSLGQPIPDVPIEPPPTLSNLGPRLPPSFASQSREYLPPYSSQTDADGRSKKYDIKLDRPVSKITVHVTYA